MLGIGIASLAAQADIVSNKVAVIGQVATKGAGTLSITDKKGSSRSFVTDVNTKIFGSDNAKLSLSDIALGNVVAAIATSSGATESAKAALLQKIYVGESSASAKIKQQAIGGILTGVNGGVVTIAKFSKQDQFYTIPLAQGTMIKSLDAKIASSSSLTLGLGVVIVGTVDDSGTIITPSLIQITSKSR